MKKSHESGNPANTGLFKPKTEVRFSQMKFLFSKFSMSMTTDSPLVELFDCPTSTVLKVADKPPLLGGKIVEVPTAAFSASEGVTWTEAVLGSKTLKGIITNEFMSEIPSAEELAITHRLQNPFDLVICDMGSSVGKGVFLSPNSPIIKKGDIVIHYAGKLSDSGKRSDDPDFDPYEIITCESELFKMDNDPEFPINGRISGLTHRNIAAYIQDGPHKDESERNLFHKSVEKNVATANLGIRSGIYRGCPVTYLVATDDIDQQLLFPYSHETFWPAAKKHLGIERRFFTRDGAVIDQKYHDKKIIPYFLEDGRVVELTSYLVKAYIKANEALKSPVALSVPELVELLGYDPRNTEKAVSMSMDEHTTLTLRLAINDGAKRANALSNDLAYDFLNKLHEKIKAAKSLKEVSDSITYAFSAKNPDYVKMAEFLKPIKDLATRIILNHNKQAQKHKADATLQRKIM